MRIYIKLNLPFCLYLRDGLYELVVPELSTRDTVLISLAKLRREKSKIDYVSFYRAELTDRGELWHDRNGTFRRTTAVVILPASIVPPHLDPTQKSYYDQFPTIIDAAAISLNRLITIYRYITQDTYLPNIGPDDVSNVFEVGTCSVAPDGSVQGSGTQGGYDNRLTNTIPDYDEATHEEINRWLASTDSIPLYEEFMMNARFLLQERNQRATVIEVQTAFEVFVSHTVRQHYLVTDMSATQIDNILSCGLINLVKEHVIRATGKSFKVGEANYDRWHSDTYLMRNRVVHNGYSPSEREALCAVLGVEHALEYLIGRPKDKFWPKVRPPTAINEFLAPDA